MKCAPETRKGVEATTARCARCALQCRRGSHAQRPWATLCPPLAWHMSPAARLRGARGPRGCLGVAAAAAVRPLPAVARALFDACWRPRAPVRRGQSANSPHNQLTTPSAHALTSAKQTLLAPTRARAARSLGEPLQASRDFLWLTVTHCSFLVSRGADGDAERCSRAAFQKPAQQRAAGACKDPGARGGSQRVTRYPICRLERHRTPPCPRCAAPLYTKAAAACAPGRTRAQRPPPPRAAPARRPAPSHGALLQRR